MTSGKRTYRVNPETMELEEITSGIEWVNGGLRYGRETLDEMKRKNLVPPTDFTEHWEKKAKERDAMLTQGGTQEVRTARREAVREAYERVAAGYRPRRTEDG